MRENRYNLGHATILGFLVVPEVCKTNAISSLPLCRSLSEICCSNFIGLSSWSRKLNSPAILACRCISSTCTFCSIATWKRRRTNRATIQRLAELMVHRVSLILHYGTHRKLHICLPSHSHLQCCRVVFAIHHHHSMAWQVLEFEFNLRNCERRIQWCEDATKRENQEADSSLAQFRSEVTAS